MKPRNPTDKKQFAYKKDHIYHAAHSGWIWLIFIAIVLVLTGCRQSAAESTNTTLDPKTRWLQGEPCAPPCWENITPGLTPTEDMELILKASPAIDDSSVQHISDGPSGYTTWEFVIQSNRWNGRIVDFLDSDTVFAVALYTPDLCLGEIIDAYGDPDYLNRIPYEVAGVVDLVWENNGILYEVRTGAPQAAITEDTCEGIVILYPIGTDFEDIPSPSFIAAQSEDMIPWTGYGKY